MRWTAALLVLAVVPGCLQLPGVGQQQTPYYADVLGASPFTTLVIEVDHAPGRAPSEAALTHLKMTFANITRKAEIKIVTEDSLPDRPTEEWTPDELVALELQTRTTRHEAPNAVLHVLYPAGIYANGSAAGVTVAGPVIGPVVVFLDTIRSMRMSVEGNPLPVLPVPDGAVAVIERSTLLHEAGHAIGLVDNGLPMVKDHKVDDASRGAHSSNPESVMWYAVDTTEGLREYFAREKRVPDEFDVDDRNDIKAGGGK